MFPICFLIRLIFCLLLFHLSNFVPQPIGKCRRVFQALLPYAVEELCNVAESLIVPVRMGIARPTAPFTLASTSIDAVQGSEELFSVEPLPPRPSPDQSNKCVHTRTERLIGTVNSLVQSLLALKS